MSRALWQLLLQDPSDLTCDECFVLMEYYAETLASGGEDLFSEIAKHLEGCPDCRLQHQEALRDLLEDPAEEDAAVEGAKGNEGRKAKGERQQRKPGGEGVTEER